MTGCDLWKLPDIEQVNRRRKATTMKHIVVKLVALIAVACSPATAAR